MNRKLLLIAGLAFLNLLSLSAQWSSRASLPSARSQHNAVMHPNGKIYVFDGLDASGTFLSSATDIYNTSTNSWTTGAGTGVGRRGAAYCLGTDNKIYSISGYGSGFLTDCRRYDVSSNTWSTVANIPTATWMSSAVSYGGKIYVFGGENATNLLQIYNISTNSWSSGASLPVALKHAQVALDPVNGAVYLMGGVNSSNVALSDVYKYNISTNSWSALVTNIPAARTQSGITYLNGYIYLIGGKNSYFNCSASFFNTTYQYDIANNTWSTLANYSVSAGEMPAVTDGSAIYVLGGCNSSKLSDHYIFYPKGQTLDFDGVNDFVVTGTTTANISNKTFSAWVKLNSTSQTGGGLISLETTSGNTFDAIVYNETGQGWGFGSNGFARTAWSGVTEISTSAWVHIAATYENNNYKLYRNGVLILTTTSYAVNNFAAGCQFLIGKRHTSGTSPYLNAQIDEVSIWNYARSCSEINATMNHSLVGNETGLIAYYNFNDGLAFGTNTSVTTLNDLQSNITAKNGTLTNFALSGSTSNWVAPGSPVSGTTPDLQPEINVRGNNSSVLTGDTTPFLPDSTNFGMVNNGTVRRFKIENTGTGTLTVSSVTATGANAADFTLSGVPTTVAAGSFKYFYVSFSSAFSTLRKAVITIASNDCDESSYSFNIQAQKGTCLIQTLAINDTMTNFSNDSSARNCANWKSGKYPDSMVNIVIQSGAELKLRPGDVLRVHNIFVKNGGKLLMSGGTLYLYGSLGAEALTGDVFCDSGKVVFCGTDTNKIINHIPRFYNVDINKRSGIVYLDGYGFEVSKRINFIKGILRSSGSGSLEILSGGTCNEGNALSFAACEVRKYNIGSSFVFPTGKGDKWARIGLNNISGGTNWRAEYYNSGYSILTVQTGSGLNHVSKKEYWDIDPDGPSTADVKLYWEDAAWSGIDLTRNSSDLKVAHFIMGVDEWENAGNSSVSFNNSGYVTASGFNNFSPFTLGSASSLIPLNLSFINFNVTAKNKNGLIQFEVSGSESGSLFEIERSLNGIDFTTIGNLRCADALTAKYSFEDNSPIANTTKVFYRVKWNLLNGKTLYTQIKALSTVEKPLLVSIYPNPAQTSFTLNLEETTSVKNIELLDITGKQIHIKWITLSEHQLQVTTDEGYADGIYNIRITAENRICTNMKISLNR